MSTINDGGPACKCARCDLPAERYQGHQWLCAMHYRFGQMRTLAKRRGKAVPTHQELHALASTTCSDCGTQMNWLAKDNQARVATLQHYRDGSFGIVCRTCNTRHAFMPGDSYRHMPKDHKHCPQCNQQKPLAEFSKDNGRSGPMKVKSWCKQCSSKSLTEWRRNNREHYNRTQRAGRARRAAS